MTKRQKQYVLLLAAIAFAGLPAPEARAFTTDVSSATADPGGISNELASSTSNAILPGTPGVTTPNPSETLDTLTASLGVPNVLLDSEFNIFNVSPAEVTEWGTAYGEIWNGNNTSWGGATIGLPVGRLGVFLGRPYAGTAGSIGQPTGAFIAGRGEASNNPLFTGVQNGAGGAWLGSLNNEPVAVTGHALYDSRVLAPRNLVDLIYGIPLSDKFSLGIAYAYARNKDDESWSDTNPAGANPNTAGDGSITNERRTADHQISLGFLAKQLGAIQKFDIAVNLARANVENRHAETRITAAGATAATANSTLESDGGLSFGFLARMIFGSFLNERDRLITAFTFNRPNVSSKGTFQVDTNGSGSSLDNGADIDRSWELDDKAANIRLDAAYHQMPTEALKVIYSFTYVRQSSKREFTLRENNPLVLGLAGLRERETREETLSGLPVGISVEHQTWSKVATRFGVRKTLFGKNTVDIEDRSFRNSAGALLLDQVAKRRSEIDSSLAATATFGLGFKPTKDVDIDVALVTNLFDLDTGAGTADIVSRASFRWHF